MAERVIIMDGHTGERTRAELTSTPPRIEYRGVIYHRVDDPDTGKPLGAYLRTQWDD